MRRNAIRRRPMSEGVSTPFTPAGALTVDFVALLLLGRKRGYLTPDDLIGVMEFVELTPALIAATIGRVTAEGIEWRDDTDLDTDLEEGIEARDDEFEDAAVDEVPLIPPDSALAGGARHQSLAEREREAIEDG